MTWDLALFRAGSRCEVKKNGKVIHVKHNPSERRQDGLQVSEMRPKALPRPVRPTFAFLGGLEFSRAHPF